MKVILKKSVPGTGKKDEIVEVKNGFAMNFLLPRQFAEVATEKRIRKLTELKTFREEKIKELSEKSKEIAQKLKNITLLFKEKCSAKGKLYASIPSDLVAKSLQKESGISIPPENFLDFPNIKEIGDYKIEVKLSDETSGHFKIKVEEKK